MIDISGWVYGLFGPYGGWGVLLCLFLIFFIDAVIFPMLPEVFFMIAFFYDMSFEFGILVLLAAGLGEMLGVTLLYLVVERIGVPERVRRVCKKYVNFLAVSDERIFLVNRFAPMIPFSGAFMSMIDEWSFKKCMFYNMLGYLIKYGIILVLAGLFLISFDRALAQNLSIVLVMVVIAISFMAAYIRKKKEGLDEVC